MDQLLIALDVDTSTRAVELSDQFGDVAGVPPRIVAVAPRQVEPLAQLARQHHSRRPRSGR